MVAEFGQAAWDDLLVQLQALSNHTGVRGKLISLGNTADHLVDDAYDVWDTSRRSIEAVNDLTGKIRAAIEAELGAPGSNIQYVVIVGGHNIVPFRRVPDETVISNERYYLMGAFLNPGSPLFSSIMQGFNLTDDFYVDREPTPWQGRALYVPDLAVGRLVETPDEIGAAAEAFVASNGVLGPATGFVSGYDFFADGSHTVADALDEKVATDRLIDDS